MKLSGQTQEGDQGVSRQDQAKLCAPAVFTICSLKVPLLLCACELGVGRQRHLL